MSPDLDDVVARLHALDPAEIVRRYDVEFDVPLRNNDAVGILRILNAFEPDGLVLDPVDVEHAGPLVASVGAHWCAIVADDVQYRLLDGLHLVEESQKAATALREWWDLDARWRTLAATDRTRIGYVLARWFDGAGKLRYRLGAFSRARLSFEVAVEVAAAAELWWTLPDLRSNLLRARFEELRQAIRSGRRFEERLQELRAQLEELEADCKAVARRERIRLSRPREAVARRLSAPTDLEFLRGYSSVLHNLAVTEGEGKRHAKSLAISRRAAAISTALGDRYRQAQALNHQATMTSALGDPARARRDYERVIGLGWRRGALIARQNLASLHTNPAEVVAGLRSLLHELERPAARGRQATDIDIHAYTVTRLNAAATRSVIAADLVEELAEEIEVGRLVMARSVRQVVAIPSYKQEYAVGIRPTYLGAAERALEQGHEDVALGYVEESSARDLLDMMASSSLPTLDPPAPLPPNLAPGPSAGSGPHRRRGRLERRQTSLTDPMTAVLAERAEEFETALVRNPVEAAPHDAEVAHRLRMFAANHPGLCMIRYFPRGAGIAAFVMRGRSVDVVDCASAAEITALARVMPIKHAPSATDAADMWRCLLEKAWPLVMGRGDKPDHLVIVPTDDVFAIPLHLTSVNGDMNRPLGVEVALSFSVSATAFVTRSRHMLRYQIADDADDLAAVVLRDNQVSGDELFDNGWNPERITLAGDPPALLRCGKGGATVHEGNWEGVRALAATLPEFFVYAGHGDYITGRSELGPYLWLRNSIITQYDVALRLRLPRNKLTILGACLAGQGAEVGGGEVAGFLRSLMAAGAGAIALPLWSVADGEVVRTTRSMLATSRRASRTADGIFDVVGALHDHYVRARGAPLIVDDALGDDVSRAETMPFALYL